MTDISKELLVTQKEALRWLRVLAIPRLRKTIETTLTKPEEKLVYSLSDGERSVRTISKKAGVSKGTVSNYWSKWSSLGIVDDAEGVKGRKRHIISLSELGIDIPEVSSEKEFEPSDN